MFPLYSVLRGPKARVRAQGGLRAHRSHSSHLTQRDARLQVELLEDRRLLSATPTMLADLAADDSTPRPLFKLDGLTYFSANDGTHGMELWRTDGTPEGTALFKDINPGSAGANPKGVMKLGEDVFFFAEQNGAKGLWKTDGTDAGTVPVKTLGASPGETRQAGGAFFFTLLGDLWLSDGTESGTVLLKDFPGSKNYLELTNVNGRLFFAADNGTNGTELWTSDGTAEGTVLVKNIRPGGSAEPRRLTNVGGTLFFNADDGAYGRELWTSDGTAEGTVLVKDIAGGNAGGVPEFSFVADVNGVLFFVADNGSDGRELWKSDGTDAGTIQVADINPGPDSSLADPFSILSNAAGTLFFWANDGVHGYSLWKSDGSQAGTVLVKDIYPGDAGVITSVRVSAVQDFGGQKFFMANDGTHGYELWKTDGTTQGTVMVKDIAPGSVTSEPYQMMMANGTLFFSATDPSHGRELWKSDGTAEGTMLIKDVNPGSTFGSSSHEFTTVGSLTYFVANTRSTGREVWRTDGTQAGTFPLHDTGPALLDGDPENLTNVDGVLYFTANDWANWEITFPSRDVPPIGLWKSDGTAGGTVLVKELLPPHSFLDAQDPPHDFINSTGTLFFNIRRDFVDELWVSDGTEAGTFRLLERGSQQTEMNGTVFFVGHDSNGDELWKTDGTIAGTVPVADIYSGPKTSRPYLLTNVNGTLFFFANDGTHGSELWKSDGTEAGTVPVKDINPGSGSSARPQPLQGTVAAADGVFYFRADDGTHGYELWKSDGTEEGTVLVKDIRLGGDSTSLKSLTNVGSQLFFQADDGTHGAEWWTSDGTEAGTALLKDINPGLAGSTASYSDEASANVDGTFYFGANNGTSWQLWKSDGTEAGTVRVDEGITVGSRPYLANVNGSLFFSADDGVHGQEPWIIAPEVVPRLVYNDFGYPTLGDRADADGSMTLAADKLPYYAGSGPATFENVTSYVQGITALTVDLADGHGPLTADDFAFHIGSSNAPETWALGPAPASITVLPGAGVAGMDRVQIVWPDGAIQNTWLQVVVKGNDAAGGFHTNTGLATSTIFYFGSRVGDVGNDNMSSTSAFVTDASDEIAVRNHQGIALSPTSKYDLNRDQFVDATDQIIARNNVGFLLQLDIPSGVAEVALARAHQGSASALGAALAAPEEIASCAASTARSVAAPSFIARARPTRRALPVWMVEPTGPPARSQLPAAAEIDFALDDELLDSLLDAITLPGP